MARSTRTTAAAGRATTPARTGSGERRGATSGDGRTAARGLKRRNPNRWRFYVLLVLLGLIVATVVWFTVGRDAYSSFMAQRTQPEVEQTETGESAGTGEDDDGDAAGTEGGGTEGGDSADDDETGTSGTADPSDSGPGGDSGDPDAHDLANPEDCRSEDLRVDLDTGAGSHPAGDTVPIEVTVSNTGPVPCLVDVGHQSMQVEVTSGDDGIWNSTDCASGDEARALLLDIDARTQHTVTWNGQRCGADDEARAGTYRVSVEVPGTGGRAQAERVLELT